ncbi:FecR family protein [Chitinophaga caseinilytica]|uniref:FecR domain-containing protein n=1 Tax=Chitinophaga caseinilytica TaxID=2267521 RepID=A0ABZ2ZA54_9BACT
MNFDRFQYLLEQYRDQQLTPAEREELLALTVETDDAGWDALFAQLAAGQAPAHFDGPYLDRELSRVLRVDKPAPAVRSVKHVHLWKWMAAAGVLLLLAFGSYRLWHRGQSGTGITALPVSAAQIAPGREGAVLTLADGRQVVLDSLQNGTIASQQGTQVVLNNGQLVYDAHASSAASINRISTPNGRQYQVILPDGTKVWLNAASTLKYPTAFTGSERLVELSGEAYFEVTSQPAGPNGKMPFIVKTSQQQIRVTGTSFNVNAYQNEPSVKTTLLEGKVHVDGLPAAAGNAGGVDLHPGEQAATTGADGPRVASNADLAKVMAWKNGAFNFEGLRLDEAMRQLERWYDITVTYDGGMPDIRFFGEVDRNVNLGDLLEMLAGAGLSYRFEPGGQLVILNKTK